MWLVIVMVGPIAVGCFGFLVERLVIRPLYGRTVDTMLATWGLSLAPSGGPSMICGTTTTGVPNPVGSLSIGQYQVGGYSLFIIAVSTLLLASLYFVLRSM